jgi:peptidoglycan/xylan/chitin deacetylase (PgdA/CDA1 family)
VSTFRIVFSVDMDEWYHSRRWVDGVQAKGVADNRELFRRLYGSDRPGGEIIEPTRFLLRLLAQHNVRATFFVLGEIAGYYPDLVKEVADAGHEIACHGLIHVDMTVLGPQRFEEQLDQAAEQLRQLTGRRPVGYRAPNLVYAAWATAILERQGFLYDASVCPSRPIGGKYQGWAKAPMSPYHPSYDDVAQPGEARLLELPLPAFPGIRLAAGSSIITRVFGFHWSRIAIASALKRGHTGYYVHPWEFGSRPPTKGNRARNLLFLRRIGPWMSEHYGRLLEEYGAESTTAGSLVAQLTAGSNERRTQSLT